MPAPMNRDKVDGRRQRSEQSRAAIVDAMLELLRDGNPRPGAQAIAERAGVSLRSVFRHFEDLDALYLEVSERQVQTRGHLFQHAPKDGPLNQRIDSLVNQRALLYEEISPVRRAGVRLAPFHPPLRARLAEGNAFLRAHLPAVFAPELGSMPAAERRDVLDALEVATSWPTWETLRIDQNLTLDRAKGVVARMLTALILMVTA